MGNGGGVEELSATWRKRCPGGFKWGNGGGVEELSATWQKRSWCLNLRLSVGRRIRLTPIKNMAG